MLKKYLLEAKEVAHLNRLRAVVAKGRQRQEQEAAVRHHRDARLRAAPAPPGLSVEVLAGAFIPGQLTLRQMLTQNTQVNPSRPYQQIMNSSLGPSCINYA